MPLFPYDVYFYEAFAEEKNLLKKYLPQNIRAGYTWKTVQETGDSNPPAGLISIRTQSVVPPDWSAQLSGILSRSTGYNHLLDYQRLIRHHLPLGYLPRYCPRSVAEQALLMWMTLLRKLPQQLRQFSDFHRDGLTGEECAAKTLLVVGVGHIGYEVVQIGLGLDMQVFGVDIVQRHSDVFYVSIEEGLAEADIIVCAMNLTLKNRGYFNYNLLGRAKRKAVFVNISRGELSPAQDLLKLMQKGKLGGIALDAFNEESELALALRKGEHSTNPAVAAVLKLSIYDNVILTPHNAFNTVQAVRRKAEQSARQVQSFLNQEKFIWPVPLDET